MVGRIPARVDGSSARPGSAGASAASALALVSADSVGMNRPGRTASASPIPTLVATTVVARNTATARSPVRLSASMLSLAVSPRMIEANTSGTTIIWIRPRNSDPGSAAHCPMGAETVFGTRPRSGPISSPAPIPSTIATTTLSHRRLSTSCCSCADSRRRDGSSSASSASNTRPRA